MGGHKDWPNFTDVSETIEANTLLMSGPMSVMERILYGVRRQQENLEYTTLLDADSCERGREEVKGRAGGTRKKYSDDWLATEFGEGLLELLGAEEDNEECQKGRVGEGSDVRSFFATKTHHVFGVGKLNDLLSGIAEGARVGYVAAWKRWFQFTHNIPQRKDG